MSFVLQPADVLIQISTGNSPPAIIKRWGLGSPYEHCFLYMGRLSFEGSPEPGIPMIFESAGRGVVLQSANRRYGQRVLVMRVKKIYQFFILSILKQAVLLASDPQAYYDYFCIIRWVLPRLLLEKLSLPMPVDWQRNPWHICSEALYEVFYRVGLEALPSDQVPMPGDFVKSPLLYPVWEGVLIPEIISEASLPSGRSFFG